MPTATRQVKTKPATDSKRLATMSQARLNFFGAPAVKISTMMWPRIIWQKGSAITLVRWDGFRDVAAIKLRRVTFRFINDNAAQVAALLAGDIDGMPRFGAVQAIAQLRAANRFNVEIGSTSGKGILAMNNKRT